MAKRGKRAESAGRDTRRPELPAVPALERHSGEGSASVLESLRKLESGRRRLAGQPPEPPPRPDDLTQA